MPSHRRCPFPLLSASGHCLRSGGVLRTLASAVVAFLGEQLPEDASGLGGAAPLSATLCGRRASRSREPDPVPSRLCRSWRRFALAPDISSTESRSLCLGCRPSCAWSRCRSLAVVKPDPRQVASGAELLDPATLASSGLRDRPTLHRPSVAALVVAHHADDRCSSALLVALSASHCRASIDSALRRALGSPRLLAQAQDQRAQALLPCARHEPISEASPRSAFAASALPYQKTPAC